MNIHKLVKKESLRRRYSSEYMDLMKEYKIEMKDPDVK
jgi:hypothetical protein